MSRAPSPIATQCTQVIHSGIEMKRAVSIRSRLTRRDLLSYGLCAGIASFAGLNSRRLSAASGDQFPIVGTTHGKIRGRVSEDGVGSLQRRTLWRGHRGSQSFSSSQAARAMEGGPRCPDSSGAPVRKSTFICMNSGRILKFPARIAWSSTSGLPGLAGNIRPFQ